MTELKELLIKIRSNAHHLQQDTDDATFKATCRKMSKDLNALMTLWRKAASSQDPEQELLGNKIAGFWCDVLSTSIYAPLNKHFQKCDRKELEPYALCAGTLVYSVGKHHGDPNLVDLVDDLCQSLVACCDTLQKGMRLSEEHLQTKPGSDLPFASNSAQVCGSNNPVVVKWPRKSKRRQRIAPVDPLVFEPPADDPFRTRNLRIVGGTDHPSQ